MCGCHSGPSSALPVMMTLTTVERVFELVPSATDWKVRSSFSSSSLGALAYLGRSVSSAL